MRRRDFLASVGALAASGAAPAVGQPRRLPRVALASAIYPISDLSEEGTQPRWQSFIRELRRLGVIEGQTVIFERYSTLGVSDPAELGRSIAATKPDILFVGGDSTIAREAATAARDLPVVFSVADALAGGLVSNLAHPGGNLTGVNTTATIEAEGKRIALMKEAVPQAKIVGYLDTVSGFEPQGHRPVVESAAASLGIGLITILVDRPFDESVFRSAFSSLTRERVEGLVIAASSFLLANMNLVARLAFDARLPASGADPALLEPGLLMAYGASREIMYARAANQVFRILNGVRPGDLPVLQPENFDLVISLKTVKDLGLSLPQSLLLQATELRA